MLIRFGESPLCGADALSIEFIVQRDINPGGLSIDRWYADQLQRLKVTLPPPSTSTVLGGRPAIRHEVIGRFGKNFDIYTTLHKRASKAARPNVHRCALYPRVNRVIRAAARTASRAFASTCRSPERIRYRYHSRYVGAGNFSMRAVGWGVRRRVIAELREPVKNRTMPRANEPHWRFDRIGDSHRSCSVAWVTSGFTTPGVAVAVG
jgi:hypothetical protein